MARDGRWTSASELADYAFCPRSHWYGAHPPPGGPSREGRARSRAGQRYHARTLVAERRRATRGPAYWAGLLVGIALLAAGVAWIFRP